jgi:hypothetical protein
MTSPPRPTLSRTLQSKPRRVHLVLRDGSEVEGGIFLNPGQSLAPYLGTRKGGWVNLVDATWLLPEEAAVAHAVLQCDHLMYAYGVEEDASKSFVQNSSVVLRRVEVTLTNDTHVRGDLAIAERQRLSDFLFTSGKFIPLVGAVRVDTGQQVGDIALNHAAVRVLHDAGTASVGRPKVAPDKPATLGTPRPSLSGAMTPDHTSEHTPDHASEQPPDQAATPAGVVMRTTIQGPDAPFIVETIVPPGVPPRASTERRQRMRPSLRLNVDDATGSPVEEYDPGDDNGPYSAHVNAIADRAALHWLTTLAERFGLAVADPRKLTPGFTTEDLWTGIARANDLSVTELAEHVGASFRLPVARFNEIEASAVAVLSAEIVHKYNVCPLRLADDALVVACSDPTDRALDTALREASGRAIRFEVAAPQAIRGALDWWYRESV